VIGQVDVHLSARCEALTAMLLTIQIL